MPISKRKIRLLFATSSTLEPLALNHPFCLALNHPFLFKQNYFWRLFFLNLVLGPLAYQCDRLKNLLSCHRYLNRNYGSPIYAQETEMKMAMEMKGSHGQPECHHTAASIVQAGSHQRRHGPDGAPGIFSWVTHAPCEPLVASRMPSRVSLLKMRLKWDENVENIFKKITTIFQRGGQAAKGWDLSRLGNHSKPHTIAFSRCGRILQCLECNILWSMRWTG